MTIFWWASSAIWLVMGILALRNRSKLWDAHVQRQAARGVQIDPETRPSWERSVWIAIVVCFVLMVLCAIFALRQ